MSAVQGRVQLTVDFVHDLGVPWSVAVSVAEQLNRPFANGIGTNQVDGIAKFTLSPGASTTVEIDLQSIEDVNGATVSFDEIRGIFVWAETANDDAVHMKQGAVNPWTTGLLQGTAPELPIDANGFVGGAAPKVGQWTAAAGSKTVGFENQSGSQANTVTGIVFGHLT